MKNQIISPKEVELRNLIRERKEIVETISKLSKRKRFLVKKPHQTQGNQDHQAHPQGETRKLVKKQIIHEEPKEVNDEKEIKKGSQEEKDAKDENQSDESKKLKAQMLERNRRIFGGLSSHLKKAKSSWEAEKPKREEKNKIMEQISKKEKEKNQQVMKEEISKLQNELNDAERKKEHNSKQILRIQNQILLETYSRYSSSLQSFLFTSTEPSIAWKPAKEFQAARTFLGDSQKQFQMRRGEIEVAISQYDQKFDFSSYTIENECEYYKNLLKNYYSSIQRHFMTDTEPPVLWKPARPYERLSDLCEKCGEGIKEVDCSVCQIGAKLGARSDEYLCEQEKRLKRVRQKVKEEESEGSHSPFPYVKQSSQ